MVLVEAPVGPLAIESRKLSDWHAMPSRYVWVLVALCGDQPAALLPSPPWGRPAFARTGYCCRMQRTARGSHAMPTLEQEAAPSSDLLQTRQKSVHSRQVG